MKKSPIIAVIVGILIVVVWIFRFQRMNRDTGPYEEYGQDTYPDYDFDSDFKGDSIDINNIDFSKPHKEEIDFFNSPEASVADSM